MRSRSLRREVLLAWVAGVALSIALCVLAATVALKGNVLAMRDLAGLADDLAGKLRFDAGGRPAGFHADIDDLGWIFDSLRREVAYRVLDEAGAVAMVSPAGLAFWTADAAAQGAAPGPLAARFEFLHAGVTVYGASAPVVHQGRRWTLQLAVSARFMHLLHRVALPLVNGGIVVFSGVLLVAFGLCAWVTLRYTLKPLRDVSESAAAIAPRSLHARLQTEAVPVEIAPLVESFNRALERLEQGYRVQQEFLAHAAHELKTPLALIRAQIELGYADADARAALLGDVEYMTRQVQQLLLLAEASESRNYSFAEVRVHELAGEAVDYLQRMAQGAGTRLELVAPAAVSWQADRGALFTLLKNLLENAIQHAPAASAVRVEVGADALTVRDMGPGVGAAQLPLLFGRFWRGAHRRDHGAGLGLAICHEIALAHGWSLTAERAEPGMRFRLGTAPVEPVRSV